MRQTTGRSPPQPEVPDGIRGRLQQVAEPDEDADLADEQAEDGSHFHDAAGEPHAGGPHDVLDDSLFGRAEDGGLHGKDAEPQDGPVQIVDSAGSSTCPPARISGAGP